MAKIYLGSYIFIQTSAAKFVLFENVKIRKSGLRQSSPHFTRERERERESEWVILAKFSGFLFHFCVCRPSYYFFPFIMRRLCGSSRDRKMTICKQKCDKPKCGEISPCLPLGRNDPQTIRPPIIRHCGWSRVHTCPFYIVSCCVLDSQKLSNIQWNEPAYCIKRTSVTRLGRILKVFGNNFSCKSSPNMWWLLTSLE